MAANITPLSGNCTDGEKRNVMIIPRWDKNASFIRGVVEGRLRNGTINKNGSTGNPTNLFALAQLVLAELSQRNVHVAYLFIDRD